MAAQPMTNAPASPRGPFETELEALTATNSAYDAPGGSVEHNHGAFLNACRAAAVYVGAYDHKILRWLSGYEPSTCAVITGIITRAADATPDLDTPDLETLSDNELCDLLLNQTATFLRMKEAAERTGAVLRARGRAT